MPDKSWVIDKGKTDGATPGFRVKIPELGKFMLKADFGTQPERPSAASAIGVRIYHAAGFHVACDSVVYFKPGLLKLNPGLKVTDNTGVTRPFDQAALEKVLKTTPRRGDEIRMQSSQWLSGVPLGPFTYDGVREDDPNDVIPHQDRRELRGARLLAAWINHFDAREQNTMSVWMAADEKKPDTSPGYVKHYYLDMSDSLGSEWDWDGISRRLGHSYYLDFADIGRDFLTLGLIERPWDRARRQPGAENLGYFPNDDFEAEGWKAGYPNPAFSRMTEHDGAWMTRIIARFTPAMIAAIVKTGQFTNPYHERLVNHALLERRRLILHRYLGRLSPLTDFAVGEGGLCGVDLARQSGVFPEKHFGYRAEVRPPGEGAARPVSVTAGAAGSVCLDLRPEAPDSGVVDDDPSRYRVVTVHNEQAPGALSLHLYDLGPRRGLRLVGLERPLP
ncbi:MAG: hypothetical protein EOO75_11775 [Myxococcales bacterium]|nr:MAG: hypothetical protein EOO75_11775 [Myxococcales bacterium]